MCFRDVQPTANTNNRLCHAELLLYLHFPYLSMERAATAIVIIRTRCIPVEMEMYRNVTRPITDSTYNQDIDKCLECI